MKLQRLKIRGVGCIRDELTLDTGVYGEAEVLVVKGPNGAGKTTLCESVPGVLYGEMPSRGHVARMASGTEAMIEAVIETDQAYTVRRIIDATKKTPKQEAYIFDAAGKPLNDGKVSTFAAEVARRFPSQAVFLASGFAAQKGNGQFLAAPKAERRALFAEMLGLGRLQELAKSAGERARETELRATELRAKVAGLQQRADGLTTATSALEDAQRGYVRAKDDREEAERIAESFAASLEEWRTAAQGLDSNVASASAAIREELVRRDGAKDRLDAARERVDKIVAERAGLKARLAQRASIEGELAGIAGSRDALAKAEEDQQNAHLEWTKHTEAREAALAARDEWARKERAVARSVDKARADVQAAENAASGLGAVPCGGEGDFASCSLISRATKARSSLPGLRDVLAKALELYDAIGKQPALPEVPSSRYLAEAEDRRRSLAAQVTRLAELEKSLAGMDELQRRAEALDTEADSQMVELNAAREAHRRSESALVVAREILMRAEEKRREYEVSKPVGPDQARLAELRSAETRAAETLARAQEVHANAERAAAELVAVQAELSEATAEIDDCRHLQKALGPEGVQALEVDAAGPEVSDLINELLGACYGSRFTCRLETATLKADGSGTKEIFDLVVIDSEMGTEGSASDLSGGERVLVAEALSLAIAIFNCRRSSIPILDLFRDECAGALDVERAPKYVEMLRKAVRLGGFHRVYFIAHQPELWGLGDACIEVVDGRIVQSDAVTMAEAKNESEAA